jgi:hypothetical protein
MHFALLLAVLVTGKFTIASGHATLQADGKEIVLASKDEYLAAILTDERMQSKTMRVEGHWAEKDHSFEVAHLHTVKNGKQYRIAYYCPICNIWAFRPGDCVCCLQPTELRELGDEEAAQ